MRRCSVRRTDGSTRLRSESMSDLQITREGRVLRIVLNRPEKRNALDNHLCHALVESLEEAFRDASIGAILLCANGKHFCSGMDLSEITISPQSPPTQPLSPTPDPRLHEQLFTIGARAEKPIVAAVTGASLGGGMGLVGNCHIVVAHPDASFGLTEIRVGLWPFFVFRILALGLGERRVLELALTGRIVSAPEALEIGFVQEIASDPQSRATEIARTLSEFSPVTIRAGLKFARDIRGLDWATAGEIARRTRDEIFQSHDFAEGVRAFREKRPPHWPSLNLEQH
jgi:enoyl-CoA hydratase/carnithine racemase